jgi:uncharacterized OB-fold protein
MSFKGIGQVGRVKSFVVLWDSPIPGFRSGDPVILASVELGEQEGLTLQANVVDASPEDIKSGDEVTVAWEELRDGVVLPQFQLSRRQ